MGIKNTVKAIAMTSIDSATFTGDYQVISAAGLPKSCQIVRISNVSNRNITISYDGVADNDYLVAGAVLQLPFQSNSQSPNYCAKLAVGTKVYVKGTAGTGLVYLSGYYQEY